MRKTLAKKLPGGKFEHVHPVQSGRMRAIRARGNRSTETRFRGFLARLGIRRWKVRPKGVPGNPDFFFPDVQGAIFVDGCFWHGCPDCGHVPSVNRPYWREKIKGNRRRDYEVGSQLRKSGIRVMRIWEHELREPLVRLAPRLNTFLRH